MDDLSPVEPEYTPSQREELDQIDFLMSELKSLEGVRPVDLSIAHKSPVSRAPIRA